MVFNRKITLFNNTIPYGNTKPTKKDSKTVSCNVGLISMSTSIDNLAVGVKLVNQVEMLKKSYNQEAYATINGIDYKIEGSVYAGSQLLIKLLLSRG